MGNSYEIEAIKASNSSLYKASCKKEGRQAIEEEFVKRAKPRRPGFIPALLYHAGSVFQGFFACQGERSCPSSQHHASLLGIMRRLPKCWCLIRPRFSLQGRARESGLGTLGAVFGREDEAIRRRVLL